MADMFFIIIGFFFCVVLSGWALWLGIKEMYSFLRYQFDPPTFFKDGDYIEAIWILAWVIIFAAIFVVVLCFMPFDISFKVNFTG